MGVGCCGGWGAGCSEICTLCSSSLLNGGKNHNVRITFEITCDCGECASLRGIIHVQYNVTYILCVLNAFTILTMNKISKMSKQKVPFGTTSHKTNWFLLGIAQKKKGGGPRPNFLPFFPPCFPLYFDINIMLFDTFWSLLTPKSSKVPKLWSQLSLTSLS